MAINPIIKRKWKHQDELDAFVKENKEDLIAEFIDEFNENWRAFLIQKYNETQLKNE